jgi:hypothetical protein
MGEYCCVKYLDNLYLIGGYEELVITLEHAYQNFNKVKYLAISPVFCLAVLSSAF